jgi:phosphoglucosamine mutase
MLARGARLGGEQSGHVIFLDHATTGDGILTAAMLASFAASAGTRLSAWRREVRPCPQVLLNVRVASRPDLDKHPVIGAAAQGVRRRLGASGRLLLRYSGTEPLARVMIEGEDEPLVAACARELAGVIEKEIGG